MVITILSIVSLIIVLTTFLIAAFKYRRRNSIYLIMCYISMIISIYGYITFAISKNVNEAILANKLTYIGGVFIPILILLHIFSRYYTSTKIKIALPLLIVGVVLFGLASTVGYCDIYYKNVALEFTKDGIPYLTHGYGPAYYLYMTYLGSYVIFGIGLIVFLFNQKKKVSYKNLSILSFNVVLCIIVYLLEKIFDFKFEIIPFMYAISSVIILLLLQRINRYDVFNTITNAYKNNIQNGYILFDLKLNYLGSTPNTKKIIPELEKQYIDHQLFIDEDDEVLDLIHDCLIYFKDQNETSQQLIAYNGFIYKCIPNYLYDGKRIVGYYIELIDDTKQQNYIRLINKYNTSLEQAISEKTKHILEIQEKFTFSIANLIENRDSNTGGHIHRTSDVMRILVDCIRKENYYNVSDEFLDVLVKAAPMHDLGKICIDDRILNKPGRFTDEEYEIMKTHSKLGAEIVEAILKDVRNEKFIKVAKNIAYFHHEKWDGNGYPNKIKGEDIPLEARIMALADVYDALVSKRCYKEKYTFERANEIILESMGSHFDPALEKIYLKCRDKLEQYYQKIEA